MRLNGLRLWGRPHPWLTSNFAGAGYSDASPAGVPPIGPNKEDRVYRTIADAARRPDRAGTLIEGLLSRLRVEGWVSACRSPEDRKALNAVRQARRCQGWSLSNDERMLSSQRSAASAVQRKSFVPLGHELCLSPATMD